LVFEAQFSQHPQDGARVDSEVGAGATGGDRVGGWRTGATSLASASLRLFSLIFLCLFLRFSLFSISDAASIGNQTRLDLSSTAFHACWIFTGRGPLLSGACVLLAYRLSY